MITADPPSSARLCSQSVDRLGALQRQVMEILWRRGEASVHDMREALGAEPARAYTTVLSVLQGLERAGWVTHRRQGRAYCYGPAVSRRQAAMAAVHVLIDDLFDGDKGALLQLLIEDESISESDLKGLRRRIRQRRKDLRQ